MITGRDPLRGSPEEFIFRNSRIPIRFLDGPDAFPGEPAAIPCMYSADSKKISNYNLGRDNPTRLRNLGRWRGAGPTGRSRSFGEPEPFIRILGSECLGLRHFGVCGPVFLILQTGKWFRYCRRTSSTCAWAAVPPARRRGEGVIATPRRHWTGTRRRRTSRLLARSSTGDDCRSSTPSRSRPLRAVTVGVGIVPDTTPPAPFSGSGPERKWTTRTCWHRRAT